MNGKTSREDGIELYHEGDETSLLFPNLVQNDLDWEWKNIKTKRMSATRAFLLGQKITSSTSCNSRRLQVS